jgi:hypothetical protein
VSEPEGGQAGRGVDLIPAAITGLLRRRAVISKAVRFHDQSKLGPEDREDPAMKTAEATRGQAMLNGAWSEAKLKELAAGDHAVMAARHLPSATAVLVSLPRYSGEK